MSPPSPIPARELPCPNCGYDLRATPRSNSQARCPECGTLSSTSTSSQIPWLHRQHRGTTRAYLQTLHLLFRHPQKLAHESSRSISLPHARRFHQLSLLLATLIATTLLMITFFLRGGQWIEELTAHVPQVVTTAPPPDWPQKVSFPIFALTDSPWIAFPLLLSTYFTLALSTWVYRLFLRAGTGNRGHRERVRRLGYYASGLLPPVVTLLGIFAAAGMVIYEDHPWLTGPFETAWQAAIYIFPLLIAATFYIPTLQLVWHLGRWRLFRITSMLILFPNAAILTGCISATAIFWTTGYLLIALGSMFT